MTCIVKKLSKQYVVFYGMNILHLIFNNIKKRTKHLRKIMFFLYLQYGNSKDMD